MEDSPNGTPPLKDRITQVLTNGATTCTYSAGTCVGYGFDDNGNQTSMHDAECWMTERPAMSALCG